MNFIAGLFAAMAISTVGLVGSTSASAAAEGQQNARGEEVTAVGCIRAWKPAPGDVTRLAENREPGMAGMFVLTPLVTSPAAAMAVPTYLLTPTASANFHQHLDRKVEVVGVTEAAPQPPTFLQIATAPTQRPEERPNAQSFPRLIVRSITRIADSCPS